MLSFDEVRSQLAPSFQELEKKRQELIAHRSKGWIGVLISFVVGLVFFFVLAGQGVAGLFLPLFVVVVGCLISYGVFFAGSKSNYASEFKARIVNQIAKALAPEVTYQPHRMVEKSWFQGSGLFSGRVARYNGEDYFGGRIGDTDLFFSEIHAESKHTRHDSDGNTETYYKTIFQGLFVVADFHKDFQGEVFVRPDGLEKWGSLGRALQKLGGKVERMENPEFERLFKVTASNAVEARYILTPAMQERMIELSQKFSPEIGASFRGSLIYLAIPKTEDWFEGRLDVAAGNESQLRRLFGQLHACFGLVEQLDLNTRIWTKT